MITGPHTGRGPKGYKRSDQQIIEEASQRLERDGDVDATDIEVTAENCVITLRGTVPDRATKRRAEECVESVYGVRDVMNELRVAPQSGDEAHGSQTSRRSHGSRGYQGFDATDDRSTAERRPVLRNTHRRAAQGGGASASGSDPSAEEQKSPKH